MANKINYTGSSKVIRRICEAINDIIDNGSGSSITTSTASATTLSEGSSATVSTSITNNNIDFQFGIPKGDTGATGPQGPTGPSGANGVGVPSGGTTGQVLTKTSGTDYDTHWETPSGGGGGSTVSITPTLSAGTKIADYSINGVTGELYAPSAGGGNAMWKVLFKDSAGNNTLAREYVANGDDCLYGGNDDWSTSAGGSAVADVTKNITQNLTLFKVLQDYDIVQEEAISPGSYTKQYNTSTKELTLTFTNVGSIGGVVVEVLDSTISKVTMTLSNNTNTVQYGTCTKAATLPGIITTGSGRQSYYTSSSTVITGFNPSNSNLFMGIYNNGGTYTMTLKFE